MTSFVALLRGINVGGKKILPMSEFRELLVTLGCEDLATYVQSGNAVFRHHKTAAELSLLISEAVRSRFGFQIPVMVLTASEFGAVGRSRLASNVERCLAVPATARNRRTLDKIGSMLDALA